MAVCPKDGTPLEIDYGMVPCPTCGAVLFIDLDGQAHIGSDSSIESAAPETRAEAPPLPEVDPVGSDEFMSVMELEALPEEQTPPPPVSIDVLSEEPVPADELNPLASMFEEENQPPPFGPEARPLPAVVSDPLGVQDYANSEFSQAKDGPLLFRLFLSGIDSKEIRESLREALEDTRFAWDVDMVMAGVSRGELRIENVSPVKAAIIVNRIKRLPLRVRWEQYAITQAESF